MRALSAEELLNFWDAGRRQGLCDRALSALSAACPEMTRPFLSALSLGERDRLLLRLREMVFGSELQGIVDCPACGDPMQIALRVGDLYAPAAELCGPVEYGGYRIEFRPVNSSDLRTARQSAGVNAVKERLVELCIQQATWNGNEIAAAALPVDVVQKLAAAMEQADPQSNVELSLTCMSCGHAWQPWFDIAAFFWSEINAWAMRTLYEVHRLALAYGWREAEIIGMDPARRQIYLEMVGT